MRNSIRKPLIVRWFKFHVVGFIGIIVQLAMLRAMTAWLHMQYLLATALAVEVAVLHNFVWHEQYTWRGRREQLRTSGEFLVRLLRFHLSNGRVSIGGNLILMRFLVGLFRIPILVANVVAIGICSLLNFCCAEWWVFNSPPKGDQIPRGESLSSS